MAGCDAVRGLQIHHKDHVADGGGHEPENLMTLCRACHHMLHATLAAAPAALDRAVHLINHRYGRVAAVDLRFARQVVFQPAVLPPQEEG